MGVEDCVSGARNLQGMGAGVAKTREIWQNTATSQPCIVWDGRYFRGAGGRWEKVLLG